MKRSLHITDYGIYTDHTHSFIIALENNSLHVEKVVPDIKVEQTDEGAHDKIIVYNRYYKGIAEKLEHANRIIVFGPSGDKFKLVKEIRKQKLLRAALTEVRDTNKMSKNKIIAYTRELFNAEIKSFGLWKNFEN